MRKVLLYFISRKRKSQRGKMNCMSSCLPIGLGLMAHGGCTSAFSQLRAGPQGGGVAPVTDGSPTMLQQPRD